MVFNRVGSWFITGLPADNRIPELLYLGTNRGLIMIEKLNKHLASNINSCNMSQNIMVACTAIEKINELVEFCNDIGNARSFLKRHEEQIKKLNDAVYESGKDIAFLRRKVLELGYKEPEPADPYAEQRKWIGKACWFWDGGAKTRAFGKLNQVDTEYNDAPFQTNFGQWYEHCEPVKPDDDIIYKGE